MPISRRDIPSDILVQVCNENMAITHESWVPFNDDGRLDLTLADGPDTTAGKPYETYPTYYVYLEADTPNILGTVWRPWPSRVSAAAERHDAMYHNVLSPSTLCQILQEDSDSIRVLAYYNWGSYRREVKKYHSVVWGEDLERKIPAV